MTMLAPSPSAAALKENASQLFKEAKFDECVSLGFPCFQLIFRLRAAEKYRQVWSKPFASNILS